MSAFRIDLPDDALSEIAALVEVRLGGRPRKYMTTAEAAGYLRCLRADGSINTNRLHKLASQRRIPHRREGDRLLFVRHELDEWIDSGEAAL
jgi:hypothetical protein